jgi:hypothetical protein
MDNSHHASAGSKHQTRGDHEKAISALEAEKAQLVKHLAALEAEKSVLQAVARKVATRRPSGGPGGGPAGSVGGGQEP